MPEKEEELARARRRRDEGDLFDAGDTISAFPSSAHAPPPASSHTQSVESKSDIAVTGAEKKAPKFQTIADCLKLPCTGSMGKASLDPALTQNEPARPVTRAAEDATTVRLPEKSTMASTKAGLIEELDEVKLAREEERLCWMKSKEAMEEEAVRLRAEMEELRRKHAVEVKNLKSMAAGQKRSSDSAEDEYEHISKAPKTRRDSNDPLATGPSNPISTHTTMESPRNNSTAARSAEYNRRMGGTYTISSEFTPYTPQTPGSDPQYSTPLPSSARYTTTVLIDSPTIAHVAGSEYSETDTYLAAEHMDLMAPGTQNHLHVVANSLSAITCEGIRRQQFAWLRTDVKDLTEFFKDSCLFWFVSAYPKQKILPVDHYFLPSPMGSVEVKPRGGIKFFTKGPRIWGCPTFTFVGKGSMMQPDFARDGLVPIVNIETWTGRTDLTDVIFVKGAALEENLFVSTRLIEIDMKTPLAQGKGELAPIELAKLEHLIKERSAYIDAQMSNNRPLQETDEQQRMRDTMAVKKRERRNWRIDSSNPEKCPVWTETPRTNGDDGARVKKDGTATQFERKMNLNGADITEPDRQDEEDDDGSVNLQVWA